MATKKQVNYAMHLLDEAGYGTRYMNAGFKALGASDATAQWHGPGMVGGHVCQRDQSVD